MRDIGVKAQTVAGDLLFLLALSIAPVLAEEYAGTVVAITDGDTLTLLIPATLSI